jgi:hypothetical protein
MRFTAVVACENSEAAHIELDAFERSIAKSRERGWSP